MLAVNTMDCPAAYKAPLLSVTQTMTRRFWGVMQDWGENLTDEGWLGENPTRHMCLRSLWPQHRS